MHFRAAPGATLRTTAVQRRLTDVNIHLRKLEIWVSTDPKKKLEDFQKFSAAPPAARAAAAL
jgi:hypothetical protein